MAHRARPPPRATRRLGGELGGYDQDPIGGCVLGSRLRRRCQRGSGRLAQSITHDLQTNLVGPYDDLDAGLSRGDDVAVPQPLRRGENAAVTLRSVGALGRLDEELARLGADVGMRSLAGTTLRRDVRSGPADRQWEIRSPDRTRETLLVDEDGLVQIFSSQRTVREGVAPPGATSNCRRMSRYPCRVPTTV